MSTDFVPIGELFPDYPDTGERVTVDARDLHWALDLIDQCIEDRDDEFQAALDRCRLLLAAQAPDFVAQWRRRLDEYWTFVRTAADGGRLRTYP